MPDEALAEHSQNAEFTQQAGSPRSHQGPDRSQAIDIVTAEGAACIEEAVREHAPLVIRCLDPFQVAQWNTKALENVRRGVWSELREMAEPAVAR